VAVLKRCCGYLKLIAIGVSEERVDGRHNLWLFVAHKLPQNMLRIPFSLSRVLKNCSASLFLAHPVSFSPKIKQPWEQISLSQCPFNIQILIITLNYFTLNKFRKQNSNAQSE